MVHKCYAELKLKARHFAVYVRSTFKELLFTLLNMADYSKQSKVLLSQKIATQQNATHAIKIFCAREEALQT